MLINSLPQYNLTSIPFKPQEFTRWLGRAVTFVKQAARLDWLLRNESPIQQDRLIFVVFLISYMALVAFAGFAAVPLISYWGIGWPPC